MKANFGLSNEQFQILLVNLKEGNEKLFEEVFLSHFQDCCEYLKRKCSLSFDDAYDITMQTLIEFRKRMIDGKVKYGNLRFLFTQMAYHNFIRARKKKDKNDFYRESTSIEDENENFKVGLEILQQVWTKIGDKCQQLLRYIFYNDLSYSEIAQMENASQATIRKRKERCVNQLRVLFKNSGH